MKDFNLAKQAIDAGYSVTSFNKIGSTNFEALKEAQNNKNKHWFVSDNQLSGRGRLGRVWVSNKGNLAASLLIAQSANQEKNSILSFVAALAVFNAIKELDKDLPLVLKWPNDILVKTNENNGLAKLVGILLEAKILTNGEFAIVLGFGVNIVNSPKDITYSTISLAELNCNVDANILFEKLSKHWLNVYKIYNEKDGVEKILNLWQKNAFGMEEKISIINGAKNITGIFKNIDKTGRLVVKTNDGYEYISAGDVHFGDARSLKE